MGSYLTAGSRAAHTVMTVKIEDRNKNNIKRKFDDTFTEDDKISKETSPKLKRKKVSIGTEPSPPVQCPPGSVCSSQTSFSLPATVCYEAEGILVVQLEWRGKTYFGTLLSQDKCARNFKISENFPILNKSLDSEVKQESDNKDNVVKHNENTLIDKPSKESSEDLVSQKSENKNEVNKENSTDCFDFDNEDILDKESTLKLNNNKKAKKQFTKGFKCDLCDKKYTWYTGLSNHKRFVHNNKTRET